MSKPLKWLYGQSWRADACGDLALLLLSWAPSADAIEFGPGDILEAHEMTEWALVAAGIDTRNNRIRFASATDRWMLEFRQSLNGQPPHSSRSQRDAVAR